METMKLVKKVRDGISLIFKCVGMALAVAVFVCLILGNMQTMEAVKILSLAVGCLGVGVLSSTHQFKE